MRFVLFDDETTEPIGVIAVHWITEDWIEANHRQISMPVFPRLSVDEINVDVPVKNERSVVDIKFVPLVRKGRPTGYVAFTDQSELALLLPNTLLPGQRKEAEQLGRQELATSLERLLRAFIGTTDGEQK